MKNNKVKRLKLLRRVLSVIAVVLAVVMVSSGVMHFVVERPGPDSSIKDETIPEMTAEIPLPLPTQGQTLPEEPTAQEQTLPEEPTVAPSVEIPPEPVLPDSSPSQNEQRPDGGHSQGDKAPAPQTTEEQYNDHTPPIKGSAASAVPDSETPSESALDRVGQWPVEEPAQEGGASETEPSPAPAGPSGGLDPSAFDPLPVTQPQEEPTTTPAVTEPPTVVTEPSTAITEAPSPTQVTAVAQEPEPAAEKRSVWALLFWLSAALLCADLAAILLLGQAIASSQAAAPGPMSGSAIRPGSTSVRKASMRIHVGTVHQIGGRDYQQDSLGHSAIVNGRGMLAVVADGMGGLSDGDKVSQLIIKSMLTMGQQLRPEQFRGALPRMLARVNEEVNRALGPSNLYKCGSTMVAVLILDGHFQWISVGDSRIYLYRQGYVNQLNQEHDQFQVLLADVLEGKRTYEEAARDPDAQKLTSFIGMGRLKYVDACHSPIDLEPGDRLVLVSDGVYNVIPEDRLAAILHKNPDVTKAAKVLERLIQEAHIPHQDNYTALILGFDGERV